MVRQLSAEVVLAAEAPGLPLLGAQKDIACATKQL